MYQAAIRAIPNNFHTHSTLNKGNREGAISLFFKEKKVVPQYFVTGCRCYILLYLAFRLGQELLYQPRKTGCL